MEKPKHVWNGQEGWEREEKRQRAEEREEEREVKRVGTGVGKRGSGVRGDKEK